MARAVPAIVPTQAERLASLREEILPLRRRLLEHAVYRRLASVEDLRLFAEHHVFAVWDFMSLLKQLQRTLTCTAVPWLPIGNPAARRLINEIVLAEESDVDPRGGHASHFELYRSAMLQAGADTGRINAFLDHVRGGSGVPAALIVSKAPDAARAFVNATFDLLAEGKPHRVAAAFTFGREDLIPDMFLPLLADLQERFPGQVDEFCYYLQRHIAIDAEQHSPLALQMVQDMCGDDERKWRDASAAARDALQARLNLWDAIVERLDDGARRANR